MATQIKSQTVSNTLRDKILVGFKKQMCSNKSNNTGLLLIHSPRLGVHWKTAAHPDSNVIVNPDQPFHFASIGKTVTSVMVSILYEKGLIDFDDEISKFLGDSLLAGLHIYKGIDYSKELKIKHLLNHTSGLPDYYTDKNKSGTRLSDLMISDPEHFWTPLETIDWAKQQLNPKFKPGKGFHYSDTNYELLGLIIENVTGKKLSQCLHEFIFEPLEMDNTYQIFYSEPKEKSNYPMVDLYHKGVNLSKVKSISMSSASGGIVSTTEDMLKFHKAIVENKIIRKETYKRMCDYARMGPSIYYGYGIMNFRFMCMPKKYYIWGNSGSIGAFMYYNPAMDIYMIGSFHKINYQVQPIFYIFNTLRKFNKELKGYKKSRILAFKSITNIDYN
jgi:CubicO group peptidase (beta-lactamase class C family)